MNGVLRKTLLLHNKCGCECVGVGVKGIYSGDVDLWAVLLINGRSWEIISLRCKIAAGIGNVLRGSLFESDICSICWRSELII